MDGICITGPSGDATLSSLKTLTRTDGIPAPLLAAAYTHLKVYEGRRA